MKRSPEESDANQLVYRQGPHPLIGVPLSLLGLLILIGTGPQLVQRWPEVVGSLFGIFFGAILTMSGTVLLLSHRMVFDRVGSQLVDTKRLLFLERSRSRSLAGFTEIGWAKSMESDGMESGTSTAWFPIVLRGARNDFEVFKVRSVAEARRLTCEIGEFLGLQQNHWDDAVRDGSSEFGQEYRHKQARAVSMARAFGAMPPIQLDVASSGSQAVLRRKALGGFRSFRKLFGTLMGLMGVYFMLLPALGGTFNGRKDVFWEPILIGLFMAVLGPAIVSFRRGTTIDKEEQVVRFWWAVVVQVWSKQYDLHRFSVVVYEEAILDADLVGRVLLRGDGVADLVLHKSMDLEESRSLAEELARFLGFRLVDESPCPARSC